MGSVIFESKAMSIFDLISQSPHFNLHVANCNLFLPMLKRISAIAVQPYRMLYNVWVLHQHIRNFEIGAIVCVVLAKRKETTQRISSNRESGRQARNVMRWHVCGLKNKIQSKQRRWWDYANSIHTGYIRFVALLSTGLMESVVFVWMC